MIACFCRSAACKARSSSPGVVAAGAAADDATLWDFGLFLFEGALGPDVRRQMERVRPAGVEWSYSDDAASPQPAVVE